MSTKELGVVCMCRGCWSDFLRCEQLQLTSKIHDETSKSRQVELKHNQELIQLRKEQRIKDSHIRSLEADNRQKDLILRRREEEASVIIHFISQVFEIILYLCLF